MDVKAAIAKNINVIIVATEAQEPVRAVSGTIEDKLRAAIRATTGHRLLPAKEDALQAAVLATTMVVGGDTPDGKRLIHSWQLTCQINNAMGAALAGQPLDLSRLLESVTEADLQDQIPIISIWKEVLDAPTA